MSNEKKNFPCERCGICCRNIGNAYFAKEMVLPNGVCNHLDEESNLCRIYSTRPIFCNVEAFYDKYLIKKMTREEFYRQNKDACRKFQELDILRTAKAGGFRYHQLMPQKNSRSYKVSFDG